MSELVEFGETLTRYHGKRERCAVVRVRAAQIPLGLADTERAVVDVDAASRMLGNIAVRIGLRRDLLEPFGPQLQAHCREIRKWKPREARY